MKRIGSNVHGVLLAVTLLSALLIGSGITESHELKAAGQQISQIEVEQAKQSGQQGEAAASSGQAAVATTQTQSGQANQASTASTQTTAGSGSASMTSKAQQSQTASNQVAQPNAAATQPTLTNHVSQYVRLGNGKTPRYDASWRKITGTAKNGQAFKATASYRDKSGVVYYSLNDLNGHFYGYVAASAVSEITDPQGKATVGRKYVRVRTAGKSFWSDFNWTAQRASTTSYLNQPVQVTATYHHLNGATYYSLWNIQEQWLGYANAGFFTVIAKPQGKEQRVDRYVTVTAKDQPIWSNFTWTKKGTTNSYINQTVVARYEFHHVNKGTYYSLYTLGGRWLGYVAQASVTNVAKPQGNARSGTHYVRITKRNGTIWSSFNWQKRYSTNQFLNQALFVGCWYHHLNGGFYYSLYDFKNNWIGYLNTGYATVIAKPQGKTLVLYWPVKIVKKNVPIWATFLWAKKSTTNNYYGQSVIARYAFHHVNGSYYYSLYKGNSWLGYANSNVTDAANPYYTKLNVGNYNQYQLGIPVGCEGVSLITALHYKGKATNYSPYAFLRTIPKASSPYKGFVGSPFNGHSNLYTAIFASPLAAWGRKYGNVINRSGATTTDLLGEVAKGNPVVAYVTIHFAPLQWANWPFGRVPNNNHAVVIAGYDRVNQRVYLSDPIDGRYWLSLSKFNAIYSARKMAVVVRS